MRSRPPSRLSGGAGRFPFSVLVIGAGRTGTRMIQQLQKNPQIRVITADPREELYSVAKGIIDSVDIQETLTPLNLEQVFEQTKPDMVLPAMPTEDMGPGKAPGADIPADALREKIAATAKVPIIEVARKGR